MKSIDCVSGETLAADNKTRIHWQHRAHAEPSFNSQVFDDEWLAAQQVIVNSPAAGRGASLFLNIGNTDLVLRHYRRGGMVRNISEQHYVWLGLQRTRAWREFDVLCKLEKLGLPSPRPYACQVKHCGFGYTATLITYYLAGTTLAERVFAPTLTDKHWQSIGRCIRRFHDAGLNHADLNAHNILIDGYKVSLIDFDRAKIGSPSSENQFKKNLQRLKRSLNKIGSSGPAFYNEDCWASLISGYMKA